jgi:hypothetical protein
MAGFTFRLELEDGTLADQLSCIRPCRTGAQAREPL